MDFVSEVRRRTYPHQNPTPVYAPGDFVAEIRPRRYDNSEIRQLNTHCHAPDISNEDLHNILSERHFSREGLTKLVERSIVTLIEKLLTGRPLSRIEGQLDISLSSHESPIVVNFNQIFPDGRSNKDDHSVQSLEDCYNVKMKNADLTRTYCQSKQESFPACSPMQEVERELCSSVTENMDNSSVVSKEYCRDSLVSHDGATSSPPLEAQPFSHTQAVSPVSETMGKHTRRRESDDESGYNSNEKDDSDSCENSSCSSKSTSPVMFSNFNEYYCGGFDGKNTLYTTCDKQSSLTSFDRRRSRDSSASLECYRTEMDDNDDEDDIEFEDRLIIDETVDENMRTADRDYSCDDITVRNEDIQSMEIDQNMDVMKRNAAIHCEERTQGCVDDVDSPASSDITDTDVAVDLSGNSKFTLDVVSALPLSQGLMLKNPGGFKCKLCSQILSDAASVSEHVQSQHDLFCCSYCCRTFTAKNNLKRHVRIHTGHRPYKCKQCSQSFSRRDELKVHMLRHDYSKPFRCSLCQKGYTDRASVKNHMVKEHKSRLMHVCPQCGESYDQEEAFEAHKKTHPELHQFSCNTCFFIGTNKLMALKHALLHTHKLFSCKPCNAYYADPFDYTSHVRQHKKMTSFSSYICCFCDISLSTYEQYIRHEYSHAQGKTHSCKTCKKFFKSKSLLQDHVLIHKEPECDKTLPEPLEDTKSYSMLWHSDEIQVNKSIHSSIGFGIVDFNTNLSINSASSSPSHMNCSSIPKDVYHNDDQGQLLDLSMKQVVNTNFNNPSNNPTILTSLPSTSVLRDQNVPRNGTVSSESFYLAQDQERNKNGYREVSRSESVDCQEKEMHRQISSIKENNMLSFMTSGTSNTHDGSSLKALNNYEKNYLLNKLTYQSKSKSVEKAQVDTRLASAASEFRTLHRDSSQENNRNAPLRFSPYSRDIIADLAAKFVAARGHSVLQHRAPPRSAVALRENRNQTFLLRDDTERPMKTPALSSSIWQASSTKNDRNEFNNNSLNLLIPISKEDKETIRQTEMRSHEILREQLNPETALIHHAEEFVKSESVFEHEAGSGRGFQNSAEGNVNINDGGMNITHTHGIPSYVCGDCKERFESFSELESHSVEIHKRYLCEHCKKSFTARPNRDRHARYHTGERPYKCDLCDLAFFRGDDLKYHRTTRHPSAQPYICTLCSASFTWSRDLDRHIRHSKCSH